MKEKGEKGERKGDRGGEKRGEGMKDEKRREED